MKAHPFFVGVSIRLLTRLQFALIAAAATTTIAHAATSAPDLNGANISATSATMAASAPDLDLRIIYYSKTLTPEGVTRETRYEEKMLRRRDHVWVTRTVPAAAPQAQEHAGHKEFNPAVLARHVALDKRKARLDYIDARARQVIAIPASEYDNVSFDGSWTNAFYLIDPKLVQAMPLSSRSSPTPAARWHEREKNGQFQRVLWDDAKQIPLIIESGDKAATFLRRVEIEPLAGLARVLPWQSLAAYSQKEYADFLD